MGEAWTATILVTNEAKKSATKAATTSGTKQLYDHISLEELDYEDNLSSIESFNDYADEDDDVQSFWPN